METEPSPGESRLQDGANAYQADPDEPLSEAVITAIADSEAIDSLELADEFGPLYDSIDPTALDSLFHATGDTGRSVGSVTFEYARYQVTVDQTGCVALVDLR
ncbi:HalOD1 output domain-containing protein [Natrinema sp. LN54]|uniref:HalOD1 output domain-containing protein n=1 Tax=Natrinema sp. LN54 TaxID=3458705 RepID=UPI004035043F